MPAVKKSANKALKVLFISAEVAPFSYVGGLSQVSYFLGRSLKKKAIDVRIFTPRYGDVHEDIKLDCLIPKLLVETGEAEDSKRPVTVRCSVSVPGNQPAEDPKVYLLENDEYYGKRANVYSYADDHVRFALLCRAVIAFIKTGEFVPDLIHANDWHTAYLLNLLRRNYEKDELLRPIASLLTIHNTYQGNYNFNNSRPTDQDDGLSELASLFDEGLIRQNALKRGIIYADVINTVSPTYARELLSESMGGPLHSLFREMRSKLYGILNGLDYDDFDPATDRLIAKNYSLDKLADRAANKADLQRQFGLPELPDVPLLAISGRLSSQKGIDLIIENIEFILKEIGIQLIILGEAPREYREIFEKLEHDFPDQVGTHLQSDFTLPRKIFAGADMLLMPSRYEPGGIVAIEAMRYGCVPIVRATGGLADTVTNYDPATGAGNGFAFKEYNGQSLLLAMVRAIETYRHPELWQTIVVQAMQRDLSWDNTAKEYIDLYSRTVKFRREILKPNPPMAFKQRVR